VPSKYRLPENSENPGMSTELHYIYSAANPIHEMTMENQRPYRRSIYESENHGLGFCANRQKLLDRFVRLAEYIAVSLTIFMGGNNERCYPA
jgi:hypothetical protein